MNENLHLKKWAKSNQAFLDKNGIILSDLPFFERLSGYLEQAGEASILFVILREYKKGNLSGEDVEILLDFPRFQVFGFLLSFSAQEKRFLLQTLLACARDDLDSYRMQMLSRPAMAWVLKAAELQEKHNIGTDLAKRVMKRVLEMTQKGFGSNFDLIPPTLIYQDETHRVYLNVEKNYSVRPLGFETPIKIMKGFPYSPPKSMNGSQADDDDKKAYAENCRWVFKTQLPQIIGEDNCRLLCHHSDTQTVRDIVMAILYQDGTEYALSPREAKRLCLLLGRNGDFSFHNFGDYRYWIGDWDDEGLEQYSKTLLGKLKILLADPLFGHVWHCNRWDIMGGGKLEECFIQYQEPHQIAQAYKKALLADLGESSENIGILEKMERFFTHQKEQTIEDDFLNPVK